MSFIALGTYLISKIPTSKSFRPLNKKQLLYKRTNKDENIYLPICKNLNLGTGSHGFGYTQTQILVRMALNKTQPDSSGIV